MLSFGGIKTTDSTDDPTIYSSGIDKDSSLEANASSLISNTDNEKCPEIIGLALFKDSQLVGELSGLDTAFYLLIANKLQELVISIQNPLDSTSSLDIYANRSGNTKISVDFINGSPFVNIDVKLKGHIASMNKNQEDLNTQNIEKIETAVNTYLQNSITEFLYKTSLDYNSDVCGIGRKAASKFTTNSDLKSYNWSDNYKNCIFKVTSDTDIVSGLLFTEV